MASEPVTAELLYGTTDPFVHPLVLPAWARRVPLLADAIDAGHAKRRAAGLPVDGSVQVDREVES